MIKVRPKKFDTVFELFLSHNIKLYIDGFIYEPTLIIGEWIDFGEYGMQSKKFQDEWLAFDDWYLIIGDKHV